MKKCDLIEDCHWIVGVYAKSYTQFYFHLIDVADPVLYVPANNIMKFRLEKKERDSRRQQLTLRLLIDAPKFDFNYITFVGSVEIRVVNEDLTLDSEKY